MTQLRPNYGTLSTIHNKCLTPPSIFIRFQFCLVYLKELVQVHRSASRILEILFRYQFALINDELLCL